MALRVGTRLVGVRVDDPDMVDAVRRIFAPLLVDGVDAYPNLSVTFAPEDDTIRAQHALYRGSETVLRSPWKARVLRALWAHLEGFLEPPDGLMPLSAWALVGEQGVVLGVDVFGVRLRLPEGALARVGRRALDVPYPLLDPRTMEIVVTPPRVPVDEDALRDVEARARRPRVPVVTEPGRYPVEGIVMVGVGADPLRASSPARRIASLAPLVRAGGRPLTVEALEVVKALAEQGPVRRVLGLEDHEVLAVLADLDAPDLVPVPPPPGA